MSWRARRSALLVLAASLCAAAVADATPPGSDDAPAGSIVFARGASLVRADARGRNETEIAALPDGAHVRSLKTDSSGKILLANVDGAWSWLPLDGSTKTLAPLPCADGPAQLAEDGSCVLCRDKGANKSALIINLASQKTWPIDVPAARLVGGGTARKLVWTAADGVWSAPPSTSPKTNAVKVAPESPLRAFLPSPDGSRALGVYTADVYTDVHHKQPADVLMGFALDGAGARRKAIRNGVGLEWSHDGEWVLVQDGANACLMHATGGEYKCWRGFTAASLSPDGAYALLLGARTAAPPPAPPAKKGAKTAKSKAPPAPPPPPPPADSPEGESEDGADDAPDVAVAPPSGPLSLYRARLKGSPYTEPPVVVEKIVDGAAVWVPAPAPAPDAPAP